MFYSYQVKYHHKLLHRVHFIQQQQYREATTIILGCNSDTQDIQCDSSNIH